MTVCGDNVCVGNAGETCLTCAECNTQNIVCGNDQCQQGETDGACPRDCGPTPWPLAWSNEADLLAGAVNMHRTQGTDCPTMTEPMLSALNIDAATTQVAQWGAWNWASSGGGAGMTCNGHTLADLTALAGITAGGVVVCYSPGAGSAQMAADLYMTLSLCETVIMRADAIAIGAGYAETPQRQCYFTALRF